MPFCLAPFGRILCVLPVICTFKMGLLLYSDFVVVGFVLVVTLIETVSHSIQSTPTNEVGPPISGQGGGHETFNKEKERQVARLIQELERNHTYFKERYNRNGGFDRGICSREYKDTPTLLFLCMYATEQEEIHDDYEDLSRRKGAPAKSLPM